MHELSIVLGIIKVCEETAKNNNAQSISKVELEIGELAGVDMDSFEFSWKRAVKNTMLENAVKKIKIINAKAYCLECNKDFKLKNMFDSCPFCGSYFKNIIQGKELRIKAIEIE